MTEWGRSNLKHRKVVGGWGSVLRKFLELQLLGVAGLSTGGVALSIGGSPIMLFAKLHGVLADGDGHMKAWDWKGASSFKPCIKHVNVLKKVGHAWGSCVRCVVPRITGLTKNPAAQPPQRPNRLSSKTVSWLSRFFFLSVATPQLVPRGDIAGIGHRQPPRGTR